MQQRLKMLAEVLAGLSWVAFAGAESGSGGTEMREKDPRSLQANTVNEDQTTPALFEVSGYVKWFDPAKGYGFIVPDDDLPDVLLHLSCLREGDFKVVREGARMVCDVVRTAKGIQVFRIRSVDESTAINPLQLPQRTRVVVAPESGWERAVVKWFNRRNGFGFLTRGPAMPEIFVHMETLRRWGFTELLPGQAVLVRYGSGPNGLVVELKPEDAPDASPH